MKRMIRTIFKILICIFCVHLWLALSVSAQAPEILKVDPPSWWTRSSMNPVRLMIRGRNLQGARVQVAGTGVKVIGAPKINERGTYVFVDVSIAPNAQPGKRAITVATSRGSARGTFEVLAPLDRAGVTLEYRLLDRLRSRGPSAGCFQSIRAPTDGAVVFDWKCRACNRRLHRRRFISGLS